MTHPAIERRLREQQDMIDTARAYVEHLRSRLAVERAWVAGSVARGDFNVWSDIDVVLVAADLPEDPLRRLDLFGDRPPKVEIVSFTPDEIETARRKNNPLVLEALERGVPLE